jgi:hypothetical protein
MIAGRKYRLAFCEQQPLKALRAPGGPIPQYKMSLKKKQKKKRSSSSGCGCGRGLG